MLKIDDAEIVFGKRWPEWSQEQWDEILRTVEVDDLRAPLVIRKVAEAYHARRFEVLTKSVLKLLENARKEFIEHEMNAGKGPEDV